MIQEPDQIYSLARRLIAACKASGQLAIAEQLDDALHAGSSALESLGAIRNVLLSNEDLLIRFAAREEIDAAKSYIDRVFGRI
jgi:hypothetical protein